MSPLISQMSAMNVDERGFVAGTDIVVFVSQLAE
jgi:hypothetical protein